MYVIRGSVQRNQSLRHYRYTLHLEQSLVELFKVYEELGGPAAHAAAMLDERIERCLGDARAPRAEAQSRLHAFRRAKDLHHFITAEPDLRDVKQRLLEHVLFHRSPEARWAAIRSLLISRMGEICECPMPGLAANGERIKEQLSLRTSRLGRLLVAAALFNFDLSREEPPPNVSMHFRSRGFPDHAWECQPEGGGAPSWESRNWVPSEPLCRWEYLANDLALGLFRTKTAESGASESSDRSRVQANASRQRQAHAELPKAEDRLFIRVGGRFAEGTDARQLDLIPVNSGALAIELQRTVHRRHGSDGLRVFAVVMAQLDASRPGESAVMDLRRLSEQAFGAARGMRELRVRMNKVRSVIERMCDLECSRLSECDGQATMSRGNFLTVLDRSAAVAGSPGEQDRENPHPSRVNDDSHWRVAVDAAFYRPGGATLGAPYLGLPEALFAAEAKRYPYRLALYIFLRSSWARSGEGLEVSAQSLFHESGLWLQRSSPYRSVELLKREFAGLKEEGWLGRWRVIAPGGSSPLDERYRLEAPGAAAGSAPRPRHQPAANLASRNEAARFAGQEGWA